MIVSVGLLQRIDGLSKLLQFSLIFGLDFKQALYLSVVLIGKQALEGRFVLLLAMQLLLFALKLLFLCL